MATSTIVCLDDFKNWAVKRLAQDVIDFYRNGANEETTLKENKNAFRRWRIIPRVLRDVSIRRLGTSILGHPISSPVCVAPTGLHGLAHHEAEMATAKGAQREKTAFVLSTMSNCSLEEVARAAPECLKFFQLYVFKDRQVTQRLVKRAEQSGYKALILTVDAPFTGKRVEDTRNGFNIPPHLTLGNFKVDSTVSRCNDNFHKLVSSLFDASLTWDDVKWLTSISKLPVIIKGILSGEDAKLAVEVGASGIAVSNHGGRQLDTAPPTLDVLPEIVEAVRGRCEVYVDGGVRLGTDVFKALALGAQAVFVGRPALYALAYNGEEGVAQMLQILNNELSTAMALAGCASIGDITKDLLRHQSSFMCKM